MVFVACGLNHKTAALDLRERFARSEKSQASLLTNLVDSNTANEAAMLTTCNRTEIYCDTSDPDTLASWIAHEYQMPSHLLPSFFYMHHGSHGIHHTLRVASGLDSMMIGEPQILGQMKQAFQQACQLGTIQTNLRTTFDYIFSASKRIRNRSGIGNNPISIAYAAVQKIGQWFGSYNDLRVFLIGSGETASLVAKYLKKEGAKEFLIASRTPENAQRLAEAFQAKALNISDIPQYLSQADVIISATACPLPFINQNMVLHALEKRQQKPMFFLDLAVPRDIEANVKELDKIELLNIDDLQSMIDKGMSERQTAALEAEQLVAIELDNYLRWHRSLKAKKVICDYRSQMKSLAQHELERALQKLSKGQCQNTVFHEFADRLMNKLVHAPSSGLRQAAQDGREELLDLVHYLFNSTQQAIHEKIS